MVYCTLYKIVGDRGGRQARTIGLRKYKKLKYKTMVFKIVGTGEGDRQEQLG